MDDRRRVKVSKYLAKHLRHQPERLGLTLGAGGWVSVETLLAACAEHGFDVSYAELVDVVATNDKQRFALSEDGTLIRANQGHSIDVDLELAPVVPPDLLYHGTNERVLESVLRHGLQAMGRHHVHLSADVETARRVGARRGRPVVLAVDAAAMAAAGQAFLVSENGVWLTESVPARYLTVV